MPVNLGHLLLNGTVPKPTGITDGKEPALNGQSLERSQPRVSWCHAMSPQLAETKAILWRDHHFSWNTAAAPQVGSEIWQVRFLQLPDSVRLGGECLPAVRAGVRKASNLGSGRHRWQKMLSELSQVEKAMDTWDRSADSKVVYLGLHVSCPSVLFFFF